MAYSYIRDKTQRDLKLMIIGMKRKNPICAKYSISKVVRFLGFINDCRWFSQ